MVKPKRERQRKSAPKTEERESIEIEVRFCLPDPPPPAFPGTKPADTTAKKADGPERPPVIFRF
jgi:hypothetical protein